MGLAPIARSWPALSQKLGISTDLGLIDRAWELETGSLARYARIAALDNAALVIEVDSAAVMQEISLRRRELVRKMNKHLPAALIGRIHVRISQRNGR